MMFESIKRKTIAVGFERDKSISKGIAIII